MHSIGIALKKKHFKTIVIQTQSFRTQSLLEPWHKQMPKCVPFEANATGCPGSVHKASLRQLDTDRKWRVKDYSVANEKKKWFWVTSLRAKKLWIRNTAKSIQRVRWSWTRASATSCPGRRGSRTASHSAQLRSIGAHPPPGKQNGSQFTLTHQSVFRKTSLARIND